MTSRQLAIPITLVAGGSSDRGARTWLGRWVSGVGDRWGWIGLAILLILYAAFLWAHFAPAISEPDDNGYFAQGSLLARTGHTSFKPESDAQYIGMHWLIAPSGDYISRYPPGLAVLVAGVYAALGFKASVLVNAGLALLSLVGFYLLVGRLVSWGWALAGVVLLGANPTFFHHALGCDSHMGVLCFLVWGLYWLIRWSESGRIGQVLLAGLILGAIPTFRYPDAIVGAGILAFILWHLGRRPDIGWHCLAAVAGAAIPIVPLLIHNQLLLGAFWRTGYALTNEQTGFGWDYFQNHAIDYLRQVQGNGLGMLFALGVVGIAAMICLRSLRPLGVMAALLTVPMLLLYMAYYWAPQGNAQMTMRFLLPTFPVYLLAGLWVLSELTRQGPRAARLAVPLTVIAVQLVWGTTEVLDQARQLHYQRQVLAQVTDALSAVAQPGDVIIADQQILQHLDFVRRWKLADNSLWRGGPGAGGPGGPGAGRMGRGPGGPDANPDAPSPGQAEKRRQRRELYTGTVSDRQAKFIQDVVTWAQGHRIFVVGASGSLTQMLGGGQGGRMDIVQHLSLPDPPALRLAEGRMGRPFTGALPGGVGIGPRAGGPGGGMPGGIGGGGPPGGGLFGGPGARPGGFFGQGAFGSEVTIAQWTPPPPSEQRRGARAI